MRTPDSHRLSPDLEDVAEELLAARPEWSGLELDSFKRRALAQGVDGSTGRNHRAKGLLMRPRNTLTTMMAVGLALSLFAVLGLSGTVPLPGVGDAALVQYGDQPAERPAPPAGLALALGRNDCRLFPQNFRGRSSRAAMNACGRAAAFLLTHPGTSPAQACAAQRLNPRRKRGERRSDLSACIIAAFRAERSYY